MLRNYRPGEGSNSGLPRSPKGVAVVDKFTLTLFGTVLALLGALCLDGSGLQRVGRPRIDSRTQIGRGGPRKDPAWTALGLALLAASALTGVLASLIP